MTPNSVPTTNLPARFCVGEVLVDAGANEVSAHGAVQRLESRTMAVLVYLAQRTGHVARREELLADVWRGRIVTDDSLTRAIAQLRQVLGDPGAIETLPKIGYRLKWPVSDAVEVKPPIADAEAVSATPAEPVAVSPPRTRWRAAFAFVFVFVLVLLVARVPPTKPSRWLQP